jgi:ketosteroid isomerase-like protein
MSAQNTADVGSAINELVAKWGEAELAGDTATIDSLLDSDFVGIGPFGFTLTKQEWLQRHQSGDLKYQSLNLGDTSVRGFGDAALVIGVQDSVTVYQGNPAPGGKMRFTLVAVRQNDAWTIAGFQLSQMGPPPGMGRPPQQGG